MGRRAVGSKPVVLWSSTRFPLCPKTRHSGTVARSRDVLGTRRSLSPSQHLRTRRANMIFCRRPTECLKFTANISDELLNAKTIKALRELKFTRRARRQSERGGCGRWRWEDRDTCRFSVPIGGKIRPKNLPDLAAKRSPFSCSPGGLTGERRIKHGTQRITAWNTTSQR